METLDYSRIYRAEHPRAYSRQRTKSPDGLTRKQEWIVIDPDQGYAVQGTGDEEMEAWFEALTEEPAIGI